jgi:hypothetical protein
VTEVDHEKSERQDLNPRPPECEAGVLATPQRLLVIIIHKSHLSCPGIDLKSPEFGSHSVKLTVSSRLVFSYRAETGTGLRANLHNIHTAIFGMCCYGGQAGGTGSTREMHGLNNYIRKT